MDSMQATPLQPQTGVLVGLLGLSLFGFYVLAIDQGWLLSLIQGARALGDRDLERDLRGVESRNERQRAWLLTRIRQAAPQTLALPS